MRAIANSPSAQPISRSYRPLVLYVENLEALASVFSDQETELKLSTPEYEYETFDELITHMQGAAIFKLSVYERNSGVNIDFDRMYAKVYCYRPTAASYQIFAGVDRVLTDSMRPFKFIYSFKFYFILCLSMGIIRFLPNPLGNNIYVSILLFVSMVLILVRIGFVTLRAWSTIRFERRALAKSFWKRNADQLAVAVISAVIGAVCGIVGTKVIDNWPEYVNSRPQETGGPTELTR